MARLEVSLLIAALLPFAVYCQDTEITRVKPLTEQEKRLPVPRERTRSIYLLNLVPAPGRRQEDFAGGNEIRDPSDPRGRNPTLFLLQKVDDVGERLPDGIYYRPGPDETETPKPAFVKDLTDVQSYVLARGQYKSPGRQ